MSRAQTAFSSSIQDASALLQHFDAIHKQAPGTADVLKRAGLVMALTAWETYVEDRIEEAVQARLRAVSGSAIGNFVSSRLTEDLKRFHNPNADKTRRIFMDYLDLDVTAGWKWMNYEPQSACRMLNELLSKRGDAVHRSRPVASGPSAPHLIKRDELDKAIKFLKALVEATDRVLADS